MSTPRTMSYLQTAPSDAGGVSEPFPEEEARQRESERARQRQYRERQAARENAAEGQLHGCLCQILCIRSYSLACQFCSYFSRNLTDNQRMFHLSVVKKQRFL